MSSSFGGMSREEFFAHINSPFGGFKNSTKGERGFRVEIIKRDGSQSEIRIMAKTEEEAFARACKALFIRKPMVARWTAIAQGA